ncbi:hypothetical protein E2C01_005951 [Portunus trituberculatus]|uniref:Uncharacterized protein n=1 Tax=Portunus trituberculatus TaxID=210409 RepID=A0A5B7CXY8_PORTR|nr:hypothetical protein [Portunus trituberculatus]
MSLQASGKACRIAARRGARPLSASLALLIVCKRNETARFQVAKPSAFKIGAEKAAVEAPGARRLSPGAEQPASGSSTPETLFAPTRLRRAKESIGAGREGQRGEKEGGSDVCTRRDVSGGALQAGRSWQAERRRTKRGAAMLRWKLYGGSVVRGKSKYSLQSRARRRPVVVVVVVEVGRTSCRRPSEAGPGMPVSSPRAWPAPDVLLVLLALLVR